MHPHQLLVRAGLIAAWAEDESVARDDSNPGATIRTSVVRGDHPFEKRRTPEIVGVQKRDELAGCLAKRAVAGSRRPFVHLAADGTEPSTA